MTDYLRNPLTRVWAFLSGISVLSWWISQRGSAEFQPDAAVTLSVLLIAALKSRLVMGYFMEVRQGPAWLKRATDGWRVLLFLLLVVFYFTGFTGPGGSPLQPG